MTSDLTGKTYEAAHGRWREILSTLGFPEAALSGKCQPCPLCGGTDRFQFSDRGGEGEFICRQCGAGKGMLLLMKFRGWEFRHAAQEVDAIIGNLPATKPARTGGTVPTSTADLNRLWVRGIFPDKLSSGGRYFNSRGINLDRCACRSALRFVALLRHGPSGQLLPCLLARFYDLHGKPKQIHRTYLSEEGRKADVEPVRMFMPGTLPKGGAIRLGEAAEVMGVAEGIETALSASLLYDMPVWATTSEVMLRAWVPPNNAKRVLVFGDNDGSFVGQSAAFDLAKRLVFEAERDGVERSVEVMLPSTRGDWNDVLKSRTA